MAYVSVAYRCIYVYDGHSPYTFIFVHITIQTTVRNMDKSGRGHLTNEKVYNLMQEQLSMQKSLFQMKKVIAG